MSSIGLIGYSFIKKLIEQIELTQPTKHSKLENPLNFLNKLNLLYQLNC